jgi:hypothetical protein
MVQAMFAGGVLKRPQERSVPVTPFNPPPDAATPKPRVKSGECGAKKIAVFQQVDG